MDKIKSAAILVIELLSLYIICLSAAAIAKMIWLAAAGSMPVHFFASNFIVLLSLMLFIISATTIWYIRRKIRKVITSFFGDEKYTTGFRWVNFKSITCYYRGIGVVVEILWRYRKLWRKARFLAETYFRVSFPGEEAAAGEKLSTIRKEFDSVDLGPEYDLWLVDIYQNCIVTQCPPENFAKIDPDKYFAEVSGIVGRYGFEPYGELATMQRILSNKLSRVTYNLLYLLFYCWAAIYLSHVLIKIIVYIFLK